MEVAHHLAARALIDVHPQHRCPGICMQVCKWKLPCFSVSREMSHWPMTATCCPFQGGGGGVETPLACQALTTKHVERHNPDVVTVAKPDGSANVHATGDAVHL